jgi:hypothetical protein
MVMRFFDGLTWLNAAWWWHANGDSARDNSATARDASLPTATSGA